jgi:transmembrane sensor
MSEDHKFPVADQVAEQAADWFVRLQGAAATADDWAAFERWLQESPTHAAAYEQLEGLWVEFEAAGLAIARTLDEPRIAGARRRKGRRDAGNPRHYPWLAVGAVAASLALAAFGTAFWGTTPASPRVFQTAAGQTRRIVLADGTKIDLNAASRISVSLGPDARRLEMADAEAVFDVAHDPKRPFLIKVGDRQVRVVGTEFNLRHREGQMALTVRRGVVEVRPIAAERAEPTLVTVGQQLIHHEGEAGSTLAAVEPEAAFGWTHGQLIYHDQPLSDVASDLFRRFGVPVRLADPQTAQLRFSGVLVIDNEQAVLRRIEAFAPVRAERLPDAIVLRRHAAPG